MEPVVMVGLDGSPESMAGAHWAADEAERRRVALRLMHAWPMLAPEQVRAASEIDQNYWAKRLVHHTQAELPARHPGLLIVGNLYTENAQYALLTAAGESELTLLSSRGVTSFESYFLGSVSMAVVARAARPAVVRAEAREQAPPPAPRSVVVALKLHGPCDDLLSIAFEGAAARGIPLQVVHGRSLPLHGHTPWGVDHDDVAKEITEEAQKQLAQAIRRWRERFPGMEPVETIRLPSPAEAVERAAERANLLVVGQRSHSPDLAPCPGPVAHAALHHACCPVAVVPHD
ncbi:universal stress protein [Streptomyces anulatus]|uniref:universal stress protein n=1 Tax=Streptomyces anulatus TaxID=1892 RepID=UPI0036B90321